ncbi:MAG: endonuclease III [Chloroflexi bacterium]|nr:endonuclease III [Chloroflexota bacterium]
MKPSKGDISVKEKVEPILDLLKKEYGVPKRRPHRDPISVLVQTILSQNTSDTNSRDAFRSLRACFDKWEDVADADVNSVARCIRSGGLGRIKAQRIKEALKEIIHKRGKLELAFLGQLDLSEAEDWLLRLPGVGLKTARCVLLFSLDMPALPVDTHILRVSKRLGLTRAGASPEEAHHELAKMVPAEDVFQFHVLMIEHGRKTCHARRPNCPRCVLKSLCKSYLMGLLP